MDEDDFLWFASLDMDGSDEICEPIVKKPQKLKVNSPFQFFQDMEDFQNIYGESSDFCPYNPHFPNYQTMTQEQQNWYFFWRGQVRDGWYPFTDFGYIYVLIFEYIHGFGWETPEKGYELLVALWKAYGNLSESLFHEFKDWIFDFCLLHKIDFTPYLQEISPNELNDEQIDLLFHHFQEGTKTLPVSLLLLRYRNFEVMNLEASGLWEDVQDILEYAFEACQQKCYRTRDTTLIKYYGTEKTITYSRFCYQKASYISTKPSISLTVKNHTNYHKLFLFFTSFLDYTLFSLGELWELNLSFTDAMLGMGLEEEINVFLEENYPCAPNKDKQLSFDLDKKNQDNSGFSNVNLDHLHTPSEDKTIVPHSKPRIRQQNKYKAPTINEKMLDKLREEASRLELTLDFTKLAQKIPTPPPLHFVTEKAKKEELTLDFSEIHKLREESDAVREALAVEETLPLSSILQEDLLEESPTEELEKGEEIIPETQEERKACEECGDLSPTYVEIWKKATDIQKKALIYIALEDIEKLNTLAEENFMVVELFMDEINSLSMEEMGDMLLEISSEIEGFPAFYSEYMDFSQWLIHRSPDI